MYDVCTFMQNNGIFSLVEGIEPSGGSQMLLICNNKKDKQSCLSALEDISDIRYEVKDAQQENTDGWVVLAGIPFVMPNHIIREYLTKHFVDPEVTYEVVSTHRDMKCHFRRVTFKALKNPKKPLPPRLFVAQNFQASISKQSVMDFSKMEVKCTKCTQKGHLAYSCQNSPKCQICGKGHQKRDCPRSAEDGEEERPTTPLHRTCNPPSQKEQEAIIKQLAKGLQSPSNSGAWQMVKGKNNKSRTASQDSTMSDGSLNRTVLNSPKPTPKSGTRKRKLYTPKRDDHGSKPGSQNSSPTQSPKNKKGSQKPKSATKQTNEARLSPKTDSKRSNEKSPQTSPKQNGQSQNRQRDINSEPELGKGHTSPSPNSKPLSPKPQRKRKGEEEDNTGKNHKRKPVSLDDVSQTSDMSKEESPVPKLVFPEPPRVQRVSSPEPEKNDSVTTNMSPEKEEKSPEKMVSEDFLESSREEIANITEGMSGTLTGQGELDVSRSPSGEINDDARVVIQSEQEVTDVFLSSPTQPNQAADMSQDDSTYTATPPPIPSMSEHKQTTPQETEDVGTESTDLGLLTQEAHELLEAPYQVGANRAPESSVIEDSATTEMEQIQITEDITSITPVKPLPKEHAAGTKATPEHNGEGIPAAVTPGSNASSTASSTPGSDRSRSHSKGRGKNQRQRKRSKELNTNKPDAPNKELNESLQRLERAFQKTEEHEKDKFMPFVMPPPPPLVRNETDAGRVGHDQGQAQTSERGRRGRPAGRPTSLPTIRPSRSLSSDRRSSLSLRARAPNQGPHFRFGYGSGPKDYTRGPNPGYGQRHTRPQ